MRWAELALSLAVSGCAGAGVEPGAPPPGGEAAAGSVSQPAVPPTPLVLATQAAVVARAAAPTDLPPHVAPLFAAGRVSVFDVEDEVDTHDPEASGPSVAKQRARCEIEGIEERAGLWFAELACVALDEDVLLLPEVLAIAHGPAGLWIELGSAPTLDASIDELRQTPPLFAAPGAATPPDPNYPCTHQETRRGKERCGKRLCREGSPYGETLYEICLDEAGVTSLRLENVHGPRTTTWRRSPP